MEPGIIFSHIPSSLKNVWFKKYFAKIWFTLTKLGFYLEILESRFGCMGSVVRWWFGRTTEPPKILKVRPNRNRTERFGRSLVRIKKAYQAQRPQIVKYSKDLESLAISNKSFWVTGVEKGPLIFDSSRATLNSTHSSNCFKCKIIEILTIRKSIKTRCSAPFANILVWPEFPSPPHGSIAFTRAFLRTPSK